MANVLHRASKQYRPSVNTPDFPKEDWIINPDLSAVENVPKKYWKIIGDAVSEMTPAEKDTFVLPGAKIQRQAQAKSRSVQLIVEALADMAPGDNAGQFHSSLNALLRGKSQAAKALKDQIDSASTLAELESISDDRG